MNYYLVMERPVGSKVWTVAQRATGAPACYSDLELAERFKERSASSRTFFAGAKGVEQKDYHIHPMELPE
jgi:hypothetical protein